MIEVKKPSILFPDFVADSVLDISVDELRAAGITHVVFDMDETLAPRQANKLEPQYISYIQSLQKAGFTVLIGSNTMRNLDEISRQTGAQVIRRSFAVFKPRKAYFQRVIQAAGTTPEHAIMVGDRIVNDIIGANRAGLRTVLVRAVRRKPGPFFRWYANRTLKHAKAENT